MPRKKISIAFHFPITLFFSIICITVFTLHNSPYQGIIDSFFTVGGNASSATPFDATSLSDYASLILHIFGHNTWPVLSINIICILLLGGNVELDYGKTLLVLMYCICAFISGVLSTILVPNHLLGSQGIVVLLIILSILSSAKTKSISFNVILVLIIYLVSVLFYFDTNPLIVKIIPIIGALCASIIGFVDFFDYSKPTPRKRRQSQQKTADS